MVIAAFIQAAGFDIGYLRQGDPRITHTHHYGVLTPLPRARAHTVNSAYLTQLFLCSTLYLGLVHLAVERQRKVDWTYV